MWTTILPRMLLAAAQFGPAAPPVGPPAKPFTLAQATAGLPGKGPLWASIELMEGERPLGALHCELFAEKAPLTVANFVGLARGLRPFKDPKSGAWVQRPFYDGLYVHRLVPAYFLQAGDPNCVGDRYCNSKAGTGDPGYLIADEIDAGLRMDQGGMLAMASRGRDENGSQFFITERATPWLQGHQSVFGRCGDLELIKKIVASPRDPREFPVQPLLIQRVVIGRKVTK